MREILFRGKRVDDGEWVQGDLQREKYIGEVYYEKDKSGVLDISAFFTHEVIPETVGQYTGLKDKNDKKMFEGDIVKITYLDDDLSVKKEYIRCVEFDLGMFIVVVEGGGMGHSLYAYTTNVIKPQLEIIGNVHDSETT